MNLQINEWRMASIEYRHCDARSKPKESCEADGDAGSCRNERPQRKSSLHGSDLMTMIGKHRRGLGCNSLIFPRLTTLWQMVPYGFLRKPWKTQGQIWRAIASVGRRLSPPAAVSKIVGRHAKCASLSSARILGATHSNIYGPFRR